MKRIILFALILIFSLSACGGDEEDILQYQSYPMTVSGTLTHNGECYTLTVTVTQERTADIRIDSPDALSGYSFTVDNTEIWVYYDNIRIDLHTLPTKVPLLWTADMLSLSEKDFRFSRRESDHTVSVYTDGGSETAVYVHRGEKLPFRIEHSRDGDTVCFDVDTFTFQ